MGCALLLSSQWYSHRLLEAAGSAAVGMVTTTTTEHVALTPHAASGTC